MRGFVLWPVTFALLITIYSAVLHYLKSSNDVEKETEAAVYSTEDAPPKIYTVRIKSCNSPFAWYYERCGEMFDVIIHDDEMYITTARSPQSYIRKVDCEIVLERFV